jgi:hypothetical protein
MIPSMNKILFATAVLLAFAGALIMIDGAPIQTAHACPNQSNGAAAQNANPTTPTNLNSQLQPGSSQLAAGQTA